ncbi:MAG TPA: glycosyltransferase family 9 protein [Nitrospira sp.]|nr:glycosyltransferase family 9 protein [Nitrospira sp.]
MTTEVHSEASRLGEPATIAVLRALQLGDLLCAVPAWRALRSAYPHARIALIGLPWAKEFVARFGRYFDEFIEFPGYPGLPEREPSIRAIPAFLAAMQARRFGALLQMQGSGHYANECGLLCGAERLAGYYQAPELCPDPQRFMPYPDGIPEIRRHIRLMNFLGIPASNEDLEFPLTEADEEDFRRLEEARDHPAGSYVCIHPGGRRPAHRWAPEYFAAVADRLAAAGLRIVLTGTSGEQELGQAVQGAMTAKALSCIGRTTLGAVGVLLSRARLLISNDTGLSHIAAALAVPSVIVCIGSDPIRWGPLNRHRHRVLAGRDTSPDRVLSEASVVLGGTDAPTATESRATGSGSSSTDGNSAGAKRLRILTWHMHGNYLYYLSHVPHDFFLPVGRPEPGYAGCAPGFPWPPNLHEVPIPELPFREFDCILFQSRTAYMVDQYEILSDAQRALPKLYLEHDPPQEHPTNTIHPVDDPAMLLVHVTRFNRLMWNSRRTPTRVIEHGVVVPEGVTYRGDVEKGLVIVNHLQRRGRRLGADIYDYVRARVPLDLVGMDSVVAGGLGEISHDRLPELLCRYRFVFHPVRYTSLGLALCEAMALGVPPVAVATTEIPTVIRHNVSGYVETDVDRLVGWMKVLLASPEEARRLGAGARRVARARFGIARFVRDWDAALQTCVGRHAEEKQRSKRREPRQTEVVG